MRYSYFLVFFFLGSVTQGFAQMSPWEVKQSIQDIRMEMDEYNNSLGSIISYSNEAMQSEEISEQDKEDSKSIDIAEIEDKIGAVRNLIDEEIIKANHNVDVFRKKSPYIPGYGKALHSFYSEHLIILQAIKKEFEELSAIDLNNIKSRYGAKEIQEPLQTHLKFEFTFSDKVWGFVEKTENRELEDKFNLQQDSYFEQESDFMKHYKVDSLIGYHSDESNSLYIGRQYKSKKYGLYSASINYEIEKDNIILKPVYDSIQTDIIYGNFGSATWTTALAWKNGSPDMAYNKISKESLVPDKVKIFKNVDPSARIPLVDSGHVGGNLALQNEAGNWVIKNIEKDSILTPEYPSFYALPGISPDGSIATWNTKGNNMYYPNDKIEYYYSPNGYYEFYENGTRRIISEKRKASSELFDFYGYNEEGNLAIKGTRENYSLSGRCEFYYRSGELNEVIYFNNSLWLDSIFYKNGKLNSVGYLRPESPGADWSIRYGSGFINDFYLENRFAKDSAYIEYYETGKLKRKGTYLKGSKSGRWEYINPLGESVKENFYQRNLGTKMIFPYRLTNRDNNLKGDEHLNAGLAIVWDQNYDPVMFELWDTKKNRQLKANMQLPVWAVTFVNDSIIWGPSNEYDGPEWYDIKNNKSSLNEDMGGLNLADYIDSIANLSSHKKINFPDSRFDIKRKLDVKDVAYHNESLYLKSNSLIFTADLRTGSIKPIIDNLNSELIFGTDSVAVDLWRNEALHYVMEMDGLERSFEETRHMKLFLDLARKKDHEKQRIVKYTFYQQGRVLFENKNKELPLEQYVKLEINENSDYVYYTPDQYYLGSGTIKNLVFFKRGDQYYDFEQFDLKYNRPDIILDRLGYADSTLIQAYHEAYLKRLKKMGFTEDMLKDDFHIPEIKIENFESMPSITDSASVGLNLKLNDSKYKLDRINVWVNDVAIYGTDGISLRDKDISKYTTTLPVYLAKGRNKIQVSVLNQAGAESYKQTVEIESTAGKKKPDLYLITIGESEFANSSYNLKYAAKDAHDVVELLKKSTVFGNVYSKTLVNQDVTRDNINNLKSFISKAGINDEVLIFIAGHGVLDNNLNYYFASYDMDFNNPADKGIAYEDLEGLLDGVKPLKKMLFIDACHSGEIDKEEVELSASSKTKVDGIQFRAVGNAVKAKLGAQNTSELAKSLFTDLRKGTGATVISSAGGMEFAMEGDNWNNGLFTYSLLHGIQSDAADLNQDGEIWLSELKQYVSEQVSKLSNGKQQPTSRIENQAIDYRVW